MGGTQFANPYNPLSFRCVMFRFFIATRNRSASAQSSPPIRYDCHFSDSNSPLHRTSSHGGDMFAFRLSQTFRQVTGVQGRLLALIKPNSCHKNLLCLLATRPLQLPRLKFGRSDWRGRLMCPHWKPSFRYRSARCRLLTIQRLKWMPRWERFLALTANSFVMALISSPSGTEQLSGAVAGAGDGPSMEATAPDRPKMNCSIRSRTRREFAPSSFTRRGLGAASAVAS